MNRYFSTVLLAVVLTTNYAQAQFSFGVRAGYNLTRHFQKYEAAEVFKSNFRPGFQIGVVGEYAVTDAFAIQPAFLFTTQGGNYKNKDVDSWATRQINYLQIPINAVYKLNLGGPKLLLQAGAYLGYAVSGKHKWKNNFDWYDEGEYKIKFGYDHEERMIRPFDYGVGWSAGLQLSKFQIGVGYNLGLANLSTVPRTWNESLKGDCWAFTLTYLLGK